MSKKKTAGHYNNLWAGQKGGVGKSWCSRLDAQRHVDRKINFWLMDADKGNQSTAKFYPDFFYKKSVHFSESRERSSSANSILEAAIERPVVTNCRAGTNAQIMTWIESKNVERMAQKLGVTLRYFFVSDLEPDSLNLFEPTAELFSPYMPLIFVANRGRNLSGDSFFQSQGFQALLEKFQVPVINVGLFDLELRKQIEGQNPERRLLSWGEALNSELFGQLSQMEIQVYLEDFYGQLDRAERLADLAFAERVSSSSGDAHQTQGVSTPPRERNSSHR